MGITNDVRLTLGSQASNVLNLAYAAPVIDWVDPLTGTPTSGGTLLAIEGTRPA
jgi:hypothetical protein